MKFSGEITINKPRAMVAKYFADPQYLGEYQEGFIRKEQLSGEPGKKNAKANMYYQLPKGKEMELTETVLENNLPHSFKGHYHHKHMDNTMLVQLEELQANQTLYKTEIHYTRIKWLMPKLMSILFPGMFKKPAQRWLNNFKSFVEAQDS